MYTFEYLLIFLSPAKDDGRIFYSEPLFKWNIWIWTLYLAKIIAKIVYVRKHKSKFDILNGIMEFGYSHFLPRGAFLRNHCLWVLGWKHLFSKAKISFLHHINQNFLAESGKTRRQIPYINIKKFGKNISKDISEFMFFLSITSVEFILFLTWLIDLFWKGHL